MSFIELDVDKAVRVVASRCSVTFAKAQYVPQGVRAAKLAWNMRN